jgi:hypothetical protein
MIIGSRSNWLHWCMQDSWGVSKVSCVAKLLVIEILWKDGSASRSFLLMLSCLLPFLVSPPLNGHASQMVLLVHEAQDMTLRLTWACPSSSPSSSAHSREHRPTSSFWARDSSSPTHQHPPVAEKM